MKTMNRGALTVIGVGIALALVLTLIELVGGAGESVTTDKPSYGAFETVTITGAGFGSGQSLDVVVVRPDNTVVTGDGTDTPGFDSVTADTSGNITYLYQLAGYASGVYTVNVYDSGDTGHTIVLAATTFIDGQVTSLTLKYRSFGSPGFGSPVDVDFLNGMGSQHSRAHLDDGVAPAEGDAVHSLSGIVDGGTFAVLLDTGASGLGAKVRLLLDNGTSQVEIQVHTSCSLPIGVGFLFGDADESAEALSDFAPTGSLTAGIEVLALTSSDCGATHVPSITTCKDVVPDDSSVWDFTLSGPTPGSRDDLADGECHAFSNLATGSYTLSETTQAGYTTSVSCDSGKGSDSDNDITFSLASGEDVTCTFTNTLSGADVKKLALKVLSEDCINPPPASIDVSETVRLCLRGVIHNNGPATPVNVTDASSALAPPDCTANVTTPPTSHTLTASVSETVNHYVDIHCLEPSFHSFEFENCITVTPPVIDPNPSDNCRSASYTPAAIASADVKIVDFACNPPPQIDVSRSVTVDCVKTLHNNGPAAAAVQVNSAAAAPPDCTIDPPTASQQVLLPRSVPVLVLEQFTIHCLEPSFHDFSVTNEVTIKDLHVVDPDPSSNSGVASFTVAAIASADVKIVDFACNPPPQIDVSATVTVDCLKTLHNNGPAALAVQVNSAAAAPPDCTINPPTASQQVLLPVSVPVEVLEQYTIHCLEPSFHDFSVTNEVTIKDLHVVDPDPGSNSGSTNFTVAAIASADVKIVDFACNPPPQIDVSATVTVDCLKTLHNNGPAALAVQVNSAAAAPPDCTINPPTASQQVLLPVSVPVEVLEQYTIHCLEPSFHDFSVTNEVTIKDLHVVDPDPGSNSGSTNFTVAAIASADVKIVDFACNPPPTIDVSATVTVDCVKTLHNNGPAALAVQVNSAAAAPADCTINPPTASQQVLLPVSVPVEVLEQFTIHCLEPSFHDFSVTNEVTIKDLHVVDPDPGSNSGSTGFTVAALASADLEKVAIAVGGPSQIDVSEDVQIGVGLTIVNNGPYGPVQATDVLSVVPPADCTINPPGTSFPIGLPAGAPLAVDLQFTIHCTEPSMHVFEFCDELTVDELHVIDPDPSNNVRCETYEVAAIAEADVKVTDVAVDCDEPVDVDTPFNCDVEATVHNNGPYGPVNADVSVGLAGPPDCTLTAPGAQTADNLSLAVSVPQVVTRSWTVECTDRSFHDFVGSASIALDHLHVVDSDTSNNSGTGNDEIAVYDLADLKVTGVAVDCDDPVDSGDAFQCTVDVSVHNNGPTTPVDAGVTVSLDVPADCAAPTDQTEVVSPLATSSTAVISKTFETECSLRSDHTYVATGEIEVASLHVRDPDSGDNSDSGDDTNEVFDRADAKLTALTIDCPADADANVVFTCTVDITVHNNGPATPVDVGGAANVGVPNDCVVANYNLFGQGYGLLSLVASVSQSVSIDFDITCTDDGLHQIVGCGIVQVNQLHVRDQVPVANNWGVATTTTDIEDPDPLLPGRCDTVDPPEICDNGVDDDGDTLVDEEPDTDYDGVNNCDDDDDDGDGFSDELEEYVGTAPLANCPWVVGVHNAWPPDFDNSQDVNILDVLGLKPSFGSSAGDEAFATRSDLDASGDVNILDVLAIKPYFSSSCD